MHACPLWQAFISPATCQNLALMASKSLQDPLRLNTCPAPCSVGVANLSCVVCGSQGEWFDKCCPRKYSWGIKQGRQEQRVIKQHPGLSRESYFCIQLHPKGAWRGDRVAAPCKTNCNSVKRLPGQGLIPYLLPDLQRGAGGRNFMFLQHGSIS